MVVEAEYRTQVQTHVPMETHGLVADWTDDGLTIYASTQFTASVRDEAAELFELPKNRVRVISDFTGGGFGAKYGIGNFGLLAINLSRKAGAPVRLMLDRREEHVSGRQSTDSLQRLKVGARRMARSRRSQLESYGTGGVAGGAGVGFAHAMMYPCPNVSRSSTTSSPTPAPARPSGRLDRCRASSRSSSHRRAGRPARDRSAGAARQDRHRRRQTMRARERWSAGSARRSSDGSAGGQPNADAGPVKRGVGVAQSQWVSVIHPPTACEVRITDDGSVEAFTALRTSARERGPSSPRSWPRNSASRRTSGRSYIGDTRYPQGRRPAAAGHRLVDAGCAQRRVPAARELARPLWHRPSARTRTTSCSRTGTSVSRAAPGPWLTVRTTP